MEWGNVKQELEERSYDKDNLESKIESEGVWEYRNYDIDEIVQTTLEEGDEEYQEEIENFEQWYEQLDTSTNLIEAAVLKVGAHLTGYQITYSEARKLQEYDGRKATLESETRRIKKRIGLDESLMLQK